MNLNHGFPRHFDPTSAANFGSRDWRSRRVYRLLARDGRGWAKVATYSSYVDAAEAIDQAVRRGDRSADDFRIEEGKPSESGTAKWVRRIGLAALYLVCGSVVLLVIAIFLR